MNMVMTSSRQLWAFARDKGLPFHSFLARVEMNGMPRNAVLVTFIFTALLSLIIIGSASAFNIILSFGSAGIYSSYLIIIATIIYRRFDGHKFPVTDFSLGKWGLTFNIISFCYLAVGFAFCMFPFTPNPTPIEMNWSCLLFGAILIIAFSWYFYRAKREYDGPVEYVRQEIFLRD